ncbi:hypothetical protein E8L99_09090 [Phreatobacter aquaticus]|uniref:Uncharacterized protein n=1 Tax=Phreatobacter aquaticus TaxID=2570229 RepID=A0A4D7QKK9_9HYPH|nr:hypothetical protein [Phreatobacter aquaticus]QCK85904.1 hypothetical protein E8L99_09090 [Phreatobacter aquaticus]
MKRHEQTSSPGNDGVAAIVAIDVREGVSRIAEGRAIEMMASGPDVEQVLERIAVVVDRSWLLTGARA